MRCLGSTVAHVPCLASCPLAVNTTPPVSSPIIAIPFRFRRKGTGHECCPFCALTTAMAKEVAVTDRGG